MTAATRTPEQEARRAAFERTARRRFRVTALVHATCTAMYGTRLLWLLSDGHLAALVYVLPLAGNVAIGVREARRLARESREDRVWREYVISWEVRRDF